MDDAISWVRAILSTTANRWTSLASTVPEPLLQRRPAPEEWSARECFMHALDTERGVFPVRLQAMLAGRDFEGFSPDDQGSADDGAGTAALVERLVALRAENLKILDSITDADLDRTAVHAELGRVTMRQLLHEWAAHDLDHTIQAERAIMQPFITACGPWRFYFKANDLSPEN